MGCRQRIQDSRLSDVVSLYPATCAPGPRGRRQGPRTPGPAPPARRAPLSGAFPAGFRVMLAAHLAPEACSVSTSLLRAGGGSRVRKPSSETCRHSRHKPELNRRRDHDAGGEAVQVGPPTEHEGRHHGRDARSGPTPLPDGGEVTTEHEAGRRPRRRTRRSPTAQATNSAPVTTKLAIWIHPRSPRLSKLIG